MGTGADRPDDLVRLSGGEDEFDVRRWLLDQLQQCIEACGGHHVRFVDDVDLEAAADRREERPLPQVASVVDAAMARSVDLNHVDTSRTVACQVLAGLALTARHGPRSLLAVQSSGEDTSRCGLATSSRAREQVCVIDPVVREGPLQWLSDVVLAD